MVSISFWSSTNLSRIGCMGDGAVKPRADVSKPANGPRPAAVKAKVSSWFRRARGPCPGTLLKSRAFHAPFRKSTIGSAFGSGAARNDKRGSARNEDEVGAVGGSCSPPTADRPYAWKYSSLAAGQGLMEVGAAALVVAITGRRAWPSETKRPALSSSRNVDMVPHFFVAGGRVKNSRWECAVGD